MTSKNRTLFLYQGTVTALWLIAGLITPACAENSDSSNALGSCHETAPGYGKETVRHVVLFRFKPETTKVQKDEVLKAFLALRQSKRNGSPYIKDISGGYQNSHEGSGNGFEQGFVVEFGSLGDRNYYVGIPYIT